MREPDEKLWFWSPNEISNFFSSLHRLHGCEICNQCPHTHQTEVSAWAFCQPLQPPPTHTDTDTDTHTQEQDMAPEATDISDKYGHAQSCHPDITLHRTSVGAEWVTVHDRYSRNSRAAAACQIKVSHHIWCCACESFELGVSEMTNSSVCVNRCVCGWGQYQPAVVHPFRVKDMWLLETLRRGFVSVCGDTSPSLQRFI